MINLNANEKQVLLNLSDGKASSWRGAVMGTGMTESGARGLLNRLVQAGLVEGGPSSFKITAAGTTRASKIQATLKRKGTPARMF